MAEGDSIHYLHFMNFLAHAYLSFNNPGLLAGNMISDFVKGKKQYDYSKNIFNGIKLHRAIDAFTDEHECTAVIKSFFRPHYRLYAGPIADVVYDHFLANDPQVFASDATLKTFCAETYKMLEPQLHLLPTGFQRMFPYMKDQDWLYNYRNASGIRQSLMGLQRRSAYILETDTAYAILMENSKAINEIYKQYFPLLKKHAEHFVNEILTAD